MSFGIIVNIHTNHTTIVYSTLPFHLAAFPLIGPAFDNSFGLLLSLKRQNNQLRPSLGRVSPNSFVFSMVQKCFLWFHAPSSITGNIGGQILKIQVNV